MFIIKIKNVTIRYYDQFVISIDVTKENYFNDYIFVLLL